MRKPMIAGNWKLHKTIPEAVELVSALKKDLADKTDIDIVVAPVFTALASVAEALKGSTIALAGQNCYCENSGAFTGEVSPAMLKDAGCTHVILGHSERRQIFGESDSLINRKVKAALAEGLTPIFCIGETLEERESDEMMEVLQRQVTLGLEGLSEAQALQTVVAYEPVWAIGTGKVATGEQAQEAHAFVRGLLAGLFSMDVAEQMRILYGGSVKPDNVDGLMAQTDIDGTLVGGASLKAADFVRIAQFEKS